MNDQIISSTPTNEWILKGDRIGLKTDSSEKTVSAADIVRSEYKGKKIFNGIEVRSRPSEKIKNVKINRFPAKLSLELEMPMDKGGSPLLKPVISSDNWSKAIKSLPESDQLIVEDQWFSIFEEDVVEIQKFLKKMNISELGKISLRHALDLSFSGFDFLNVTESEVTEDSEDLKFLFTGTESTLNDAGFKANLYHYQQKGVAWLNSIANEGLGCILADEMGLGKTVQIIALLTIFKQKWGLPALVVARSTILENWRREFKKFNENMNVLIHRGPKRTGFPSKIKKYDVIVTTYDTAVIDQGLFGTIEWGFIILDEAQDIKNPETDRAIAVKSFKRRISVAVTGTPVENRLLDLWSIMDFANPDLLGSRKTFEANFVDSEQSAIEIERVVSPLMLRRSINEVAKDLPEKIIVPQAINMSENEIEFYEELRQKIKGQYGRSAPLVATGKLRQFCVHPSILKEEMFENFVLETEKYLRLTEILEEIVSRKQKVIIFTSYNAMSDLLMQHIPEKFFIPCDQINGRTPVHERQKIVDSFSEISGSALLILNPRAAGAGINITAANHVIHYNLEWNPAVEDQATARTYRLGQTLPVVVHRMFYTDTIEEVIDEVIDRKRRLADAAVVGTESPDVEKSDIVRALSISPATGGLKIKAEVVTE